MAKKIQKKVRFADAEKPDPGKPAATARVDATKPAPRVGDLYELYKLKKTDYIDYILNVYWSKKNSAVVAQVVIVSYKDRYTNKPGSRWLRTVRLADLETRPSRMCVRFMSRLIEK